MAANSQKSSQEAEIVVEKDEIENLIARQESLVAQIENLIKNHKKTGKDKKTKVYVEKKLKQIQDLEREFQENDIWLQETPIELQTSNYFLKKQELEIKNLVEPYVELFRKEIEVLEVAYTQKTALNPVIQKMVRRQNVMISSLKRAFRTVEVEAMDAPSFKVKQKLWEEIQSLHFNIWEAADDPTELGYDMDVYTELEAEVLTKLNNVHQARKDTDPKVHTNSSHIPLPKVQIPKFDGEYGNWPTFHDLFVKVVHEQPIAAVQKMWFLKTNVTGEAESLIRHLSLTENNYETAWNLLKDRFSNKRVCASKILQRIIDYPVINSDAKDIKVFHDTVRESLFALENVGVSTKGWDPLLLQILVKKMDRYTHNLYESAIPNPKELQDIGGFLKFLEQRFQTLESLGPKEKRGAVSRATSATVNSTACKMCQAKDHAIYFCKRFLDMTPRSRLKMAQNHKLCINCLKPGHGTKNCTSRPCRQCSKKHNSLLHFEQSNNEGATTSSVSSAATRNTTSNTTDNSQSVLTTANAARQPEGGQNYVFLATAKVRIAASNGQSCEVRAVLDAGSQVNLITQRVINKLSLSTTKARLLIEGVGQHAGNASARINAELQSITGEFSTHFEAFVMPKIISPQPSINLDATTWCIPEDITLADAKFYQPGNIDILIGAEHYHHLLKPQQLALGKHLPLLQDTVLGWVVVGKTRVDNKTTPTCAIFASTFLGALSRFTGRRGKCKTIYCDNATNFVGAKNHLNELAEAIFSKEAQEAIIRDSSNKGIEFRFIPPRGPHFGGLWEAAVKSAKYLLTRDVSSASLTYEELETVIVGIEAILNSRPLTPMSSDPNDYTALTPGHFLIGEPLTAIAEQANETLNVNIVQRWELVARLKYEFWRRWSTEYLNELQHRHKWKTASQNVQLGDMVIMKDDNLPVLEWKIGKIEKVYLGDDGRVRVVDVKTSKGVYKRLLQLLAPLPTASPLNASTDETTEDALQPTDASLLNASTNEAPDDARQPPDEYLPNKRRKMSSPYS